MHSKRFPWEVMLQDLSSYRKNCDERILSIINEHTFLSLSRKGEIRDLSLTLVSFSCYIIFTRGYAPTHTIASALKIKAIAFS